MLTIVIQDLLVLIKGLYGTDAICFYQGLHKFQPFIHTYKSMHHQWQLCSSALFLEG